MNSPAVITIFSSRIGDIEYVRSNFSGIYFYAGKVSFLPRILQKCQIQSIFIFKEDFSQEFSKFVRENKIQFCEYESLDELKKLCEKAEKDTNSASSKNFFDDNSLDFKNAQKMSPVFASLIGDSPAMKKLCSQIIRVAAFDVSVLLLGETGTGKTTIAKAIYQLSQRRNAEFSSSVLANVSENLIEATLFGVVKGAYTDARTKDGLFVKTRGGVLHLDEIGEISLDIQTKLLQVLSEGIIFPVGSNDEIHVDNRMIFSTNANLALKMQQKLFREDLYYRINEVTLKVPPLRERIEDIPALCQAIIKEEKLKVGISDTAIKVLQTLHWKGNIRELTNVLKSAAVFCENHIIQAKDIASR